MATPEAQAGLFHHVGPPRPPHPPRSHPTPETRHQTVPFGFAAAPRLAQPHPPLSATFAIVLTQDHPCPSSANSVRHEARAFPTARRRPHLRLVALLKTSRILRWKQP